MLTKLFAEHNKKDQYQLIAEHSYNKSKKFLEAISKSTTGEISALKLFNNKVEERITKLLASRGIDAQSKNIREKTGLEKQFLIARHFQLEETEPVFTNLTPTQNKNKASFIFKKILDDGFIEKNLVYYYQQVQWLNRAQDMNLGETLKNKFSVDIDNPVLFALKANPKLIDDIQNHIDDENKKIGEQSEKSKKWKVPQKTKSFPAAELENHFGQTLKTLSQNLSKWMLENNHFNSLNNATSYLLGSTPLLMNRLFVQALPMLIRDFHESDDAALNAALKEKLSTLSGQEEVKKTLREIIKNTLRNTKVLTKEHRIDLSAKDHWQILFTLPAESHEKMEEVFILMQGLQNEKTRLENSKTKDLYLVLINQYLEFLFKDALFLAQLVNQNPDIIDRLRKINTQQIHTQYSYIHHLINDFKGVLGEQPILNQEQIRAISNLTGLAS